MRGWLNSTLDRLVLTYALGLLAAFVLVGGVSLVALDRLLERDSQAAVRAEHQGLMEVYDSNGRNGLRRTINARVREPLNREAVYLLVEADGGISAGHRNDFPPTRLPKHAGWLRFPWIAAPESDTVLAYVQPLPGGGWLLTGHTTGAQQHLRELTEHLGAVILGLLAVMTLLLGWLLRRAVDRALELPLDTVDRVAAGRLEERVPERPGDDAFSRLGRTLNRMLDRIRDLVGGIQSSSDAIAHDLRTPMMRLRTRLEQARLESADPAVRARIDAAVGEADQLLSTFNSLLRLARIEAGADQDNAPVALDEVATDAVEMWSAVAEQHGQSVDAEISPARVSGNRDLLFQLLSNLLDNAIKYGQPGNQIRLLVAPDGDAVRLEIADLGPGIPAAQHERVFDRFVRGDSHRGTPGTGLGLSVVRAIAIRHRAELRLQSGDLGSGLRVLLRFPAA